MVRSGVSLWARTNCWLARLPGLSLGTDRTQNRAHCAGVAGYGRSFCRPSGPVLPPKEKALPTCCHVRSCRIHSASTPVGVIASRSNWRSVDQQFYAFDSRGDAQRNKDSNFLWRVDQRSKAVSVDGILRLCSSLRDSWIHFSSHPAAVPRLAE